MHHIDDDVVQIRKKLNRSGRRKALFIDADDRLRLVDPLDRVVDDFRSSLIGIYDEKATRAELTEDIAYVRHLIHGTK